MKKEYLMAGFTIFCWATMAPISKLLLSEMSNMLTLSYVTAIASLSLLAVIFVAGQYRQFRNYTTTDYVQLFLIGAVGYFLYSALYYYGLSELSAQTACILNYLWPIFTACLSAVLLKEWLSLPKLVALVLSFFGVVIVVMQPGGGQGSGANRLLGYLCCILAAAMYAVFNVLNKKRGGNQLINMFVYIGSGAVLSALCCLKSGYILPTWQQIPGLLWSGVFINAVGFLLWAMALQESNTTSIANFAYITPGLSILLSGWWLKEPIYWHSVLGLALILGGFFLQMLLEHRVAEKGDV